MAKYEEPGYVPPSTLEGIKKLAKRIKKDRDVRHAVALGAAALIAGYSSYHEAFKALQGEA